MMNFYVMMSGGHSIIAKVNKQKVIVLAKSVDDAPGEVLDKIAFKIKVNPINGLGIELNSYNGKELDQLTKINISRIRKSDSFYHMSFSGIKTRVKNYIDENKCYNKQDICLSLQILIYKEIYRAIKYTLKYTNPKYISCSGGVMANKFIKENLSKDFSEYNFNFVDIKYAGDNAIMIAYLAYLLIKDNKYKSSCCYKSTPYNKFKAS